MQESDVIVIGSGASGVSAAWPLVEAGLKVNMLDQGRKGSSLWKGTETFLERRLNDKEQWRTFLGEDLFGLGGKGNETPKMKVPTHQHVLKDFAETYSIESNGVSPTGSLAYGGVTNMWGAGTYNYHGEDLVNFPIEPHKLAVSHNIISKRIGISGVSGDDLSPWFGTDLDIQPPLPLHENARKLLYNYQKRPELPNKTGIYLGHARNAVLTEAIGQRGACVRDNMCFWGCPYGSIYSADQEVQMLQKNNNFQYYDGAFVKDIEYIKGCYYVHCIDLDGERAPRTFKAKSIFLAAGTIASTILALKFLKAHKINVPVACHPAFAILFMLPSRLGSALSSQGFTLGHLAYLAKDFSNPKDYTFGVIFSMEGMLAADIIRYMPISRPSAVKLARTLIPSLLIANGYFSSEYCKCTLNIDLNKQKTEINAEYAKSFLPKQKLVVKQLTHFFRSLGAWALPRGIKIARLGSDGHFAGSFPMTNEERPFTTTPECELRGAENFYLVDGASLPYLTAKHPTFTIMANADRVARSAIKRIKNV